MRELMIWIGEPMGWSFPGASICNERGDRLFSWRLKVMSTVIPSRYQLTPHETWDSENNSRLADLGRHAVAETSFGPPSVVVVYGEDAAFAESEASSTQGLPDNLILFIETKNTVGNWMAPADLDLRDLTSNQEADMARFVGRPWCEKGFHVAFASGDVWCLRSEIPVAKMLPFLTRTHSINSHRDNCLFGYVLSKSAGGTVPY
jgi:hypothetical protein